jgi:hypothetical protein
VLQLARDDVPEEARWAFRADLLQLFLCDSSGKAGNPDWLCQADGRGWDPFAPSTLVRHLPRESGPDDLRAALPAALLDLRRRRRLEGLVAHCLRTGDPDSAALFARRLDEEHLDATAYEVPGSRMDFLTRESFLFPVGRVAGWTPAPDVPAYGDIDLDDVDVAVLERRQTGRLPPVGPESRGARVPRLPRADAVPVPAQVEWAVADHGRRRRNRVDLRLRRLSGGHVHVAAVRAAFSITRSRRA